MWLEFIGPIAGGACVLGLDWCGDAVGIVADPGVGPVANSGGDGRTGNGMGAGY